MKRTLLTGVAAAALLAGANIASAQMERPAGAAVEQRGGAGADIKANTPAGNARTQSQTQENIKAGTSGQGQQRAQDAQKSDNRAPGQARDNTKDNAQGTKADKGQSNEPANRGASAQDGDKAKNPSAAQGGGQNANRSKVTLTTEQKTRVRETVIRSSNAPRVTNVNFSVSVGTVIPRTVRYAPLPPVLVEYYPAWRGYDYVIVSEQIIILEPGTLRIVAILDV